MKKLCEYTLIICWLILTACSSSASKEITTDNIGVHKLVVTLSGDVNSFYWSFSFQGLSADSKNAILYDDNGNQISDNSGSYTISSVDKSFSSLMASTDKNGGYLTMAGGCVASEIGKKVTINIKGYIDSKRVLIKDIVIISTKIGDTNSFAIHTSNNKNED